MNNLRILGRIDLDKAVSKSEIKTKRSGYFHIQFISPHPISMARARELQTEIGYHPDEYGFFWNGRSDMRKCTWECSNSCD